MTAGAGRRARRSGGVLGRALVGVGTALLVVAVVLAFRSHAVPPPGPSDPAAYAADLLAATQEARAGAGVAALESSDCAREQAVRRAADLVGEQALEHASMEPVLRACMVDEAGENLSRAQASPAEVMDAWMRSPGHRSNLLDTDYVAVGIGCVPDGADVVCSQVFLGR